MMNTRLSACAAAAARRNAQANNAEGIRMLHRGNEERPQSIKPKTLAMINHEPVRRSSWPKSGLRRSLERALDGFPRWPHGGGHARSPRHLWHLPRDYELAIRWLRPSFLNRDYLNRDKMDARPQGTGNPWTCDFTIR